MGVEEEQQEEYDEDGDEENMLPMPGVGAGKPPTNPSSRQAVSLLGRPYLQQRYTRLAAAAMHDRVQQKPKRKKRQQEQAQAQLARFKAAGKALDSLSKARAAAPACSTRQTCTPRQHQQSPASRCPRRATCISVPGPPAPAARPTGTAPACCSAGSLRLCTTTTTATCKPEVQRQGRQH